MKRQTFILPKLDVAHKINNSVCKWALPNMIGKLPTTVEK